VRAGARQNLPDALRAAAMLGVLAINGAGYAVAPWGPIMGRAQPQGDGLAHALQLIQAALLQGKAYPVLAFLFGLGLALALRERSPTARAHSQQRLWRLLILGIAHGLLLYFGDILTVYALCGLALLRHVNEPWARLRPRLRRAAGWAAGVSILGLLLSLLMQASEGGTSSARDPSLLSAAGFIDFLTINAFAYLWIQVFGLLLGWPVIRLCMLAGVAAARLQLLTHRRWSAARGRLASAFWPMLVLNVLYAVVVVRVANDVASRAYWVDSLTPWLGLPMATCAVAWAGQRWGKGRQQWVRWLAPLGRRTLTLYVGHSALCALIYSGAGLAWAADTAVVLLLALSLWIVALALAHASPRRWPLEAWMGRRS
jgi:uncharacterized protein